MHASTIIATDHLGAELPTMSPVSPIALLTTAAGIDWSTTPSKNSDLVRIRPGVYAAAADWDELAPWDKYRTRVHAALLSFPDAALCLESAASAHDFPVFGEPRDIHFFTPERRRSKRFGDVTLHTSIAERTFVTRGGITTTSVVDTVVDLARVLPPAYGLAVADHALHRDLVTRQELRTVLDMQPSPKGRRRAAWVIENADERAESPGESISRAVIAWCGFADPELQREVVTDGYLDRVDFAWPEASVFGESDGYGKYLLDGDPMATLRREKAREDRLRRRCRAFPRWDWRDAHLITPLEQRLDDAGVPRIASRNPTMLRTLASNPRSR